MADEGRLQAQRDAPVGGQAVLEGVMMRGVSTWAVAVRKPLPDQVADHGLEPDEAPLGEIEVRSFPLVSVLKRHRVLRWPIIRGVVALGESLSIGFKALGITANAQLPEGEEEIGEGTWGGTVVLAVALAVGLFFLLPAGLTSLVKDELDSRSLFVVVEKLVRITIFLGYLWLIRRMKDLQRVFEYHGAEHKTISCYEAGLRAHARERAALHAPAPALRDELPAHRDDRGDLRLRAARHARVVLALPSRILGIPLVAGLAFEIIKLFGRNRRKRWARVLMWPGMQLQRLTTREPDLAQLAVAIAALGAVLEVENPGETAAEELVGMEVVA